MLIRSELALIIINRNVQGCKGSKISKANISEMLQNNCGCCKTLEKKIPFLIYVIELNLSKTLIELIQVQSDHN